MSDNKHIIKQEVAIVTTKYDPKPCIMGYIPNDNDSHYTILAVKEIEVEFDMPLEVEVRDSKIAALKMEREEIIADSQLEVERIDSDIQSLMALEVS